MNIEVIKPGWLTTLQDAGRNGHAHLGVGRAGAFDLASLYVANALAGNPREACALEITLSGPTLRFCSNAWIALTGAPAPLRVGGAEARMWAPVPVAAGATVEIGTMPSGCRSYLAVAGGLGIEPVLGSRSTDLNAALGPLPRPLRAGDILATSATADLPFEPGATSPSWSVDPRPWFDDDGEPALRLMPGPHLENLAEGPRNTLFSEPFSVDTDSNRVGVRLRGPALDWHSPIEMVSEGCVPGLLQLPPSGQPIAFGPECPVSGGYPRLGTIAAVDLPRLAQRRPGDAVRFRPCTYEEAVDALRKREAALRRLEAAIHQRLRQDHGQPGSP
ncbi:MAG TPA: biotin-dependent carboxyltransferase family protein [Rhodanobacteraceae bacterium]|nr:biotin-dependent carboxyltransferase family protein [Rhodanobacteraceae bacterium]